MKKVIILLIIIQLLLVLSCKRSQLENNVEDGVSMNNENQNVYELTLKEKTSVILDKVDNYTPCEENAKTYDYYSIPGYSEVTSVLPNIVEVPLDDIECIRKTDDSKYIYIVYKVVHNETTHWAFRFYEMNEDGFYIGDSMLFTNDDKGLSSTLNYTIDDLLDIDKEFVERIED